MSPPSFQHRSGRPARDLACGRIGPNLRATGKGIIRQVFGLREEILEVDAWVRTVDRPVNEIHPEVCFATLAGDPPRTRAGPGPALRSGDGSVVGWILVPAEIGVAGELAGVDDVLDAAAASWTARRYAEGSATCHPETPEQSRRRRQAAIWA